MSGDEEEDTLLPSLPLSTLASVSASIAIPTLDPTISSQLDFEDEDEIHRVESQSYELTADSKHQNFKLEMDNSLHPLEESRKRHGEGQLNSTETTFPFARVKKIMKADPDVNLVSADAAYLTSIAAELFIGFLGPQLAAASNQERRKTILYKDVAKVARSDPRLAFLNIVVPSTIPLRRILEMDQAIELEKDDPVGTFGQVQTEHDSFKLDPNQVDEDGFDHAPEDYVKDQPVSENTMELGESD